MLKPGFLLLSDVLDSRYHPESKFISEILLVVDQLHPCVVVEGRVRDLATGLQRQPTISRAADRIPNGDGSAFVESGRQVRTFAKQAVSGCKAEPADPDCRCGGKRRGYMIHYSWRTIVRSRQTRMWSGLRCRTRISSHVSPPIRPDSVMQALQALVLRRVRNAGRTHCVSVAPPRSSSASRRASRAKMASCCLSMGVAGREPISALAFSSQDCACSVFPRKWAVMAR